MPAESVLNRKYIRRDSGIPTMSAAATANVGYGLPGALTVTKYGKMFMNLPAADRHFMPACPGLNRHELIERFQKRPALKAVLTTDVGSDAAWLAATIANKDFEVIGTNMTTALSTFAAGGGITLTTAGASADQAIIQPNLNTGITSWASTTWKTDDCLYFEAMIKTGAAVTSQKIFAGLKLTNTPLTATDDDQVYFLFDTGNTNAVSATNFQCCSSRSNADTFTDSGVTVAAATSYFLQILLDPDRVPYFYINGALVGWGRVAATAAPVVSTDALTTGISLIPYVGVHALAAAAKAVTVRCLTMSKNFND